MAIPAGQQLLVCIERDATEADPVYARMAQVSARPPRRRCAGQRGPCEHACAEQRTAPSLLALPPEAAHTLTPARACAVYS